MYVTTRKIRMAGMHVQAGTIIPDSIRVPAHLVQSGRVVRLPEKLVPWPAPMPVAPEAEPEPAPELDQDELDEQRFEEESPAVSQLEDHEERISTLETDVDQYHTGQGWYELPHGKVRGRENALNALRELEAQDE